MQEIFKDIKDFEGLYQISNYGKVKTLPRERVKSGLKKTFINKKTGYETVMLYKNGIGKNYSIHKLVADAFLPKIDGKDFINHKDKNKTNNKITNLERCDRTYNNRYSMAIKVGQYTLDGNLIKVFDAVIDACKEVNDYHISEVCRGKRKSCKGFIWKYVN